MNVAVLGAGTEGRDVAALCARAGHAVTLHAADATEAMDRIDTIERGLVDAAASGEITIETKERAVEDLQATTDLEAAVDGSDIVVVTAAKDVETLQERFAEIESAVERETLIATSATGQSVTTVAAGLRHPDRSIGIHFFDLSNPAVVELVLADQTSHEAVDRAETVLESLGVHPVRVRDVPGIGSTRLERIFELEAMRAVDDDVVSVEGIDALTRQEMHLSMGPLERADREGLDTRLELFEEFAQALGPQFEPPDLLRRLVADGKTGITAGEGFYNWEGGEPVESAIDDGDILPREDRPDDPTKP